MYLIIKRFSNVPFGSVPTSASTSVRQSATSVATASSPKNLGSQYALGN